MAPLDRRSFLAAGTAFLASAAEPFSKPLGFQLYTIRSLLADSAKDSLKTAAEIGYTEVETLEGGSAELTPYFKEYALRPVSGHFSPPLITGDWSHWRPNSPPKDYTWDKAIEIATKLQMKFMVIPYLMPAERNQPGFYPRFAHQLNQAGEAAKKAGLTLCYHNHGFEFAGQPGKRPLDILLDRLDPKLVGIELDVFWCSLAGTDPAELIAAHPGRIPLLHLKDKQHGTPRIFEESEVKPETFKEVGSGSLDFPAILRAGLANGVQHFFVEQDQCPGNPLDSLRKSYNHLRSLHV